MSEKFISQPLTPLMDTLDTSRMAAGEPGLPGAFKWGKRTVRVVKVIRSWRESGPCTHGSGERYIRKHWYQVEDDQGRELKIYFERKARGRDLKKRWFLYTLTD